MKNEASKGFQQFCDELCVVAAPPKQNFIDPKKIIRVYNELKSVRIQNVQLNKLKPKENPETKMEQNNEMQISSLNFNCQTNENTENKETSEISQNYFNKSSERYSYIKRKTSVIDGTRNWQMNNDTKSVPSFFFRSLSCTSYATQNGEFKYFKPTLKPLNIFIKDRKQPVRRRLKNPKPKIQEKEVKKPINKNSTQKEQKEQKNIVEQVNKRKVIPLEAQKKIRSVTQDMECRHKNLEKINKIISKNSKNHLKFEKAFASTRGFQYHESDDSDEDIDKKEEIPITKEVPKKRWYDYKNIQMFNKYYRQNFVAKDLKQCKTIPNQSLHELLKKKKFLIRKKSNQKDYFKTLHDLHTTRNSLPYLLSPSKRIDSKNDEILKVLIGGEAECLLKNTYVRSHGPSNFSQEYLKCQK